MTSTFNLYVDCRPPMRPETTQWSELLHWCVAVLDHDDTHLPFAASLLADAVRHGGLTEKQAKYATRTLKHVTDLYHAGLLACQCGGTERADAGVPGARRRSSIDLSVIEGGKA